MVFTVLGPFALVAVLTGMDVVRRRDRVSPLWLLPSAIAIGGLYFWPLWNNRDPSSTVRTVNIPSDVFIHTVHVSLTLYAVALGLALARLLAPGPHETPRPALRMPPVPGLLALPVISAALLALLGPGAFCAHSTPLALLVPWWLAFGREPGLARLDEGGRITGGILVLACVASITAGLAGRTSDRPPWELADLLPFATAALLAAFPAALARPRLLHVLVGGAVLVLPGLWVRQLTVPRAPIEVPRLVGLDGTPLVRMVPEWEAGRQSVPVALVDAHHAWRGCAMIERRTEPGVEPSPWLYGCTLIADPLVPLGNLPEVLLDQILVEGGRYEVSTSDNGQVALVQQVPEGVRLSTLPEPVPLDALESALRKLGARAGAGNSVRVSGPGWTLQQAVSMCVTAYDAGFDSCTIMGGEDPMLGGGQAMTPFEAAHPDEVLDTADPRGRAAP